MRTVRRTPKINADATLKPVVDVLTKDERTMLVAVLRRFTGGGPYPDESNLPFWRTHYALACIKKAFRGLKPEYRTPLRALEAKVIKEATSR